MSEEQHFPEELLEEEETGRGGELVGLAYFVSEDEVSKEIIAKNFPELLPLHSRLHSLTYIDKSELRKLKYKINAILAMEEMCIEEDKYDERQHMLLVSVGEHLKLRLHDSIHGRKLKALTEQTKIVEMRMGQQKRRWF